MFFLGTTADVTAEYVHGVGSWLLKAATAYLRQDPAFYLGGIGVFAVLNADSSRWEWYSIIDAGLAVDAGVIAQALKDSGMTVKYYALSDVVIPISAANEVALS